MKETKEYIKLQKKRIENPEEKKIKLWETYLKEKKT